MTIYYFYCDAQDEESLHDTEGAADQQVTNKTMKISGIVNYSIQRQIYKRMRQ